MTSQLPHHHFPATATGPVLAVIADTHLAETTRILATAARCPVQLSATTPHTNWLLASHRSGQHRAIVLDDSAACQLAASRTVLPNNTVDRRGGLASRTVIVTNQPPTPQLYQAAITLRAEHLSQLPDDNDTVLAFFRSIIAPNRHGSIIAVRGLVGGAGASVLTAAIAQSCSALGEVVAVDADPDAPGLSGHTGLLADPGPGWATLGPMLAETACAPVDITDRAGSDGMRGEVSSSATAFCAQSLVQILPRLGQVAVLGHRANDTATEHHADPGLWPSLSAGHAGPTAPTGQRHQPPPESAASPATGAADSAKTVLTETSLPLAQIVAELADYSPWVVVDAPQPHLLALAHFVIDIVPNTWHAINQARHRHHHGPTPHLLVIRVVPEGTVPPASVAAMLHRGADPGAIPQTPGRGRRLRLRQRAPGLSGANIESATQQLTGGTWHIWPHDRKLATPTAAGRPTTWTATTTDVADTIVAELNQGHP